MPICEWPFEERPREKLLSKGASVLTDAELLAVLLGTGVQGKDAVSLARELLQRFGSLSALLRADFAAFSAVKGLGKAKYVQLQAVRELGERCLKAQLAVKALDNSVLTKQYLVNKFAHRRQEVFALMCLDAKLRLLETVELFQGSVTRTAVYPGELVKAALACHASGAVLVHNHPSGDPTPSQPDIRLTERIKQALELVEIKLVDHMIVGGQDVYSFAEHRLISRS